MAAARDMTTKGPEGRRSGTRTGKAAAAGPRGAEPRSWEEPRPFAARAATNLDLLTSELTRMAADADDAGLRSALEALAQDVARGTPVAGMLAGLAGTFGRSRHGAALRSLAADAALLEDRR